MRKGVKCSLEGERIQTSGSQMGEWEQYWAYFYSYGTLFRAHTKEYC